MEKFENMKHDELKNWFQDKVMEELFGFGRGIASRRKSCFWLKYEFSKSVEYKGEMISGFHIRPYRIKQADVLSAKPKKANVIFDEQPVGYVEYDYESGNFHKRSSDEVEFQVVLVAAGDNGGAPEESPIVNKDNYKEYFGDEEALKKWATKLNEKEVYFPNIDDNGDYSLKELVEQAVKACGLEI